MSNTFIVIGSMRSGTTSLYYYLKKHPDVNLAKKKDLYFFDKNFSKGLKWYNNFFSNKKKKIKGEVSTSYYLDNKALLNIKKTFPKTKIILLTRNKKKLLVSLYLWDQIVFYFFNPIFFKKKNSFEIFLKNKRVQNCCDFKKINSKILKIFNKKQVLVLNLEKLSSNNKELAKLSNFLNIRLKSWSLKKRYNIIRRHRFFLLSLIGYYFYKFLKKNSNTSTFSLINFFRDNNLINKIIFKQINDDEINEYYKIYRDKFVS